VNFREIFNYSTDSHEREAVISSDVLSNLFDFGRQNISGDSVADVLHSLASLGMEHYGEVPTDLELARIVAILAKNSSGSLNANQYICDPAAGSGNLISTAIDVYNALPNQTKANDINSKLLELLSLRLGLKFPRIVSPENSSEISAHNISDLNVGYFENVSSIVMNPPFVAGINSVQKKQELAGAIRLVTGRPSITNVGQMPLEGVFLELICSLCLPGTTISCILPKTHLTARGPEAVVLRNFLLSTFGLETIFSYPSEGLFEHVTKDTCIIVGKVGVRSNQIRLISTSDKVENLDLQRFEAVISQPIALTEFTSLMPGVEGVIKSSTDLLSSVDVGWRDVNREHAEAIRFCRNSFELNTKLKILSDVTSNEISRKRGTAGNGGGSDLIFMDRAKSLFQSYGRFATVPAARNAKMVNHIVGEGDSAFLDISRTSDSQLAEIVESYLTIPVREGRQQRNEKTAGQLIEIVKSEARKIFPGNSLLIPRGIRTEGKVYVADRPTIVSTNFVVLSMPGVAEAKLMASWMNTVFFQLVCEVSGKQQEGMRKMEVADLESTFVPNLSQIGDVERSRIIQESIDMTFLRLSRPIIRSIDRVWAEILFGDSAAIKLGEARRLLEFLANSRNPI